MREATDKAAVAGEIESLKRWCAAHVHDPRYRGWVVFRFPENLDYDHLVQMQRPDPALPEEIVGPDEKLRRREGFELTDNRYTRREVLSEIHYCVLCHERDKDTCSKGIRDKEGKVADQPARHSAAPAARSTRRSRRCTRCASAATRSARWRSSPSTTRCARAPVIASATTA